MENNKTTAIHCMQKSTNYTDYEGLQRKIFKAFHHISSSSYCFVTFLFKKLQQIFRAIISPNCTSSRTQKVHEITKFIPKETTPTVTDEVTNKLRSSQIPSFLLQYFTIPFINSVHRNVYGMIIHL